MKALSLHDEPRFTRDIDLLLYSGDEGRLPEALAEVGYSQSARPGLGPGQGRHRETEEMTRLERSIRQVSDLRDFYLKLENLCRSNAPSVAPASGSIMLRPPKSKGQR